MNSKFISAIVSPKSISHKFGNLDRSMKDIYQK